MSKQNPITESQADKQNHSKIKSPSLTPDLMGEPVNLSPLPDSFLAAGADCNGAPTARLNNSRLQTAQRQAIASQMGRVQGNRYLQRALAPIQRLSPDAKAAAEAPGASVKLSEEEQKKKDDFLKQPMSLANYVPSTGSGKFDAQYFPSSGQLFITVKIFFDFVSEIPPDVDEVLAPSYRWTQAEMDDFQLQFIQKVTTRWSGKKVIRCTKPGWENFTATPQIIVFATDPAEAHFPARVVKVGEGIARGNDPSWVKAKEPGHDHGNEEKREARLHSTDNTEKQNFRTEDILMMENARLFGSLSGNGVTYISFARGQAEVPAQKRSPLQKAAVEMAQRTPEAPPLPINVSGSAAKGEAAGLAQRRADAVKAVLTSAGITNPINAQGFDGGENAEVTISLDQLSDWRNKQTTSEHEFGHMLGNPDEYPADPNAPRGNNAEEWKKLVEQANIKPPTMEQWTTSQMSGGNDVLAAHYVTMWEALGQLSKNYIAQNEWQIG